MTSLTVNFIEGQRGSICRNNAFAVVEGKGEKARLLAIIPQEDLPKATAGDVAESFKAAARLVGTENKAKFVEVGTTLTRSRVAVYGR